MPPKRAPSKGKKRKFAADSTVTRVIESHRRLKKAKVDFHDSLDRLVAEAVSAADLGKWLCDPKNADADIKVYGRIHLYPLWKEERVVECPLEMVDGKAVWTKPSRKRLAAMDWPAPEIDLVNKKVTFRTSSIKYVGKWGRDRHWNRELTMPCVYDEATDQWTTVCDALTFQILDLANGERSVLAFDAKEGITDEAMAAALCSDKDYKRDGRSPTQPESPPTHWVYGSFEHIVVVDNRVVFEENCVSQQTIDSDVSKATDIAWDQICLEAERSTGGYIGHTYFSRCEKMTDLFVAVGTANPSWLGARFRFQKQGPLDIYAGNSNYRRGTGDQSPEKLIHVHPSGLILQALQGGVFDPNSHGRQVNTACKWRPPARDDDNRNEDFNTMSTKVLELIRERVLFGI